MTPAALKKEFKKLDKAITLIKSYQGDVDGLLEEGGMGTALSELEPYIETVKILSSEIGSMDEEMKHKFLDNLKIFRENLDALLATVTDVKEKTIVQTKKLKSHNKSASAYIKADNGAGS